MAYSTGAHLCALTLDVETGMVKIWKYIVVEDCGRMINKAVVEGQLQGGIVHGVGGSLLEELEYDKDGNILSTNFGDYQIPAAVDSPNVEIYHKVTPTTANLDGVKGVGESGTIGSYGAVLNAVNDAISQIRKEGQVNIAPALPEAIFWEEK
jgi:CO/xanthine dehydrogenase Mo-binding subunit